MSDFLRRIMEQQNQTLQQMEGTGMAQKSLLNEINNMRGPVLDKAQTLANLSKTKAILDSTAEMVVAEDNREAASAFGTDMRSPTSVVVETATQAREAVQRANTRMAAVTELDKTKFTEDPLGFIGALFTIPMHLQGAQFESQNALSAAARLNALNQATQTQARTNETLKRNVNAASVANAIDTAAATADLTVMRLHEQSMRSNVKDLMDVLALDSARLDILYKSFGMQGEQERLQIARDTFKLQRDRLEKQIADEKDVEANETAYLDKVNTGRTVYGLGRMSLQEFRLAFKNPKSKAMIDQWFDTGFTKQSTGISSIATDPASAMVLLGQANVRYGEGDPRRTIQEFIQDSLRTFKGTPLGQTAKPNELLEGTNNVALTRAEKQAKLIKPDDLTNIYSALPFGTISEQKGLQETALFTKVLKPQKEAGIVDIPPHQIFHLGAQAAASGVININEAVDGIVTYGKAAVATNNYARNYIGFGLPKQQKYTTKVYESPEGEQRVIDLTDRSQVYAMVMRYGMLRARTEELNSIMNSSWMGVSPLAP